MDNFSCNYFGSSVCLPPAIPACSRSPMTTACEVKKGSQRNHRKEFFFPTSPDQSPLQSLPRGGFGLPPKSPSPSPAGLAGHRTRVVPVALAVASRGRPRPLHVLYDLGESCGCMLSLSLPLPLRWMCSCQSTKLLGAADSNLSPLPLSSIAAIAPVGSSPMPAR